LSNHQIGSDFVGMYTALGQLEQFLKANSPQVDDQQ
jgi:hypothetical protein